MSQAERLTRLGEILVELSRSPIPTHFFQTLSDEAPSVVPSDYLAVCLQDTEKRGYLVHSLAPLAAGAVATRVFEPHEGLAGQVIGTGRVGVIDDLALAEGGADDLEGVLVAAGLRSALLVPVRRGFEVLGVLLFAARASTAYSAEDVQLATLMAAGLSAALETSLTYQALADERSTLAAVLASTADAVIMVNQAGIVLLANQAVRPMLGLAPDAIAGRPLVEVVDYVPLRQLFAVGREGISELPLPDGRVAQASVMAVVTPFGEPVGLAAMLRDITLLKNLEQMKNDFVNTVSHDLKGPITVIAGTADVLLRTGPGDPRHQARCQDIRDAAQHMAEMVTDLLDLGKIEAGLDGFREPHDLVPLLRESVRMVTLAADKKGIEIKVEVPESAPVTVVRTRIRQALVNLLENAVKYTPEGGRVSVWAGFTAAADGSGYVVARVTDTGIGIPARDLPHVFDKFYRVQSDATREITGTGLGLAITRSIVEAHEGRIRVESVEGAGSTFVLELPLGRG